MTNKKFRDDLAKEMRDKYNERNEKLEQAEKSSFSSGLKEQKKKEIMDNFTKEMDEMKSRPGYAEAKKTHLEEIKAKIKLAKSKKEYEDSLKAYKDAQIAHRGKVEELSENDAENVGELSQEKKEKLKCDRDKILDCLGDRDKILDYLRENCVKIEKNAEVMGYKGKKVHISLPKVGKFEGFKLDYFVSNDIVYKNDFEFNPELEKKSKSMKQIGEILKAVNRYMAELGVKTDGDMDYENDLRKTGECSCKAGDCLKDILGLDKWYWTSDKDSHVSWHCDVDNCYFYAYDYYANLFLGLSD